MRRTLKLTAAATLIFTASATAQLRLPANSSLRSDLQKVMAEYPSHFEHIRGTVVDQNPQTTEYQSALKVGGAQQCSIISYSSGTRPVNSWQALWYSGEDFEAASKKYKWLYHQLQGMNLYYIKDQYTLRGQYEEADESRGFAVTTLALVAPPPAYKKLRVDVALQFEFPDWKVSVQLYEKERDDDEMGSMDEE